MNGNEESSPCSHSAEDFSSSIQELRLELEKVRAEIFRHGASLRSSSDDPLAEVRTSIEKLESQVGRMERRSFRLPSLLLSETQAMQQLFQRFAPEPTLPAVAGWALSPTGLLALTDLVEEAEQGLVVECGSGTSTLWLAYALRRKGSGKVVALEHQKPYADRTRRLVKAHGLEEFVEVRVAPLVLRSTSRGAYRWYDVDLEDLGGRIELLVVDGPPGDTGPHSRYPALPLLRDQFADNVRVLIDDTNRKEERDVVEFWLAEEPSLCRLNPPGEAMELLGRSLQV